MEHNLKKKGGKGRRPQNKKKKGRQPQIILLNGKWPQKMEDNLKKWKKT